MVGVKAVQKLWHCQLKAVNLDENRKLSFASLSLQVQIGQVADQWKFNGETGPERAMEGPWPMGSPARAWWEGKPDPQRLAFYFSVHTQIPGQWAEAMWVEVLWAQPPLTIQPCSSNFCEARVKNKIENIKAETTAAALSLRGGGFLSLNPTKF